MAVSLQARLTARRSKCKPITDTSFQKAFDSAPHRVFVGAAIFAGQAAMVTSAGRRLSLNFSFDAKPPCDSEALDTLFHPGRPAMIGQR
jgi:hypothetical protein